MKENIGKTVTIFIKGSNFRYEGPINTVDSSSVEILDNRSGRYKIISMEDIKEMEFSNDNN